MPVHPALPLTIQWNQLCLEAIVCTKSAPPAAARALAMLHTAMFDAWSVYDQCAISTTTARMIKRKPDNCRGQHILISISYAAYRVLSHLFVCDLPAEKKTMFSEFMCSLGYATEEITLDVHTPEGIGNLMVLSVRGASGSLWFVASVKQNEGKPHRASHVCTMLTQLRSWVSLAY